MYSQANTILIGALWFVALSWLVVLILTLRGLARQKFLLPTTNLCLTVSDAPLVSILVPARNEEHRVLAACIRSILAQDYNEMWECCCKNWFSGMNFSLALALSSVASMYFGAVVPTLIALAMVISLVAGADVSLFLIPAALSWLFQVLIMAGVSRRSEVSPVYALTVH